MLKQARKAQNKSQKDFAAVLNVTQQTISAWETTGDIPEDRREEIYRLYRIDPDDAMPHVSESDRELITLLLRYGNVALKEELRERLERMKSLTPSGSSSTPKGNRSLSPPRQVSYSIASGIRL